MRFHRFKAPCGAAVLAAGLIGSTIASPVVQSASPDHWTLAQATPPKTATGSGSGGTVEGRVEGSTNSNSMGEPAKTSKTKPVKKKAGSTGEVGTGGSAGKAEGRVSGSTNSNAKGEPAKVP